MTTTHSARPNAGLALFPLAIGLILMSGGVARAQLTDQTQTPNTAGAGIALSLEEQVGAGQGDALTPGSSLYLIKRDPARAIRRGRQLFQRKFTQAQGQGPRTLAGEGDIEETGTIGAGLADSCAACHGRPRGSAGFGGDVFSRPDSRDAPHLFGLGLQEQLADEITQELRAIQAAALAEAASTAAPVTRALVAKGIGYGEITANPDGTLDSFAVEGVDEDLRVRPFFAEGTTISMREFIVGAFKAEMGLETFDACLADAAGGASCMTPAGMVLDGTLDAIEAPPVTSAQDDGDFDGVTNEVDTALVDFMEFYLLNYFKPGLAEQTKEVEKGFKEMADIGCTNCHVRSLTIDADRRVADVETVFDPQKGIFNRLFATATTLFTEVADGESLPQLLPAGAPFLVENIFADFKRHDLGPNFYERNFDGTFQTAFMTEPLWGVGSTAPYGHDGRSINLTEVILRHGGEAQDSRDQYAKLSKNRQEDILDALESLVLFPPDDTASSLDGGDPADPDFPQVGHGSIALGKLFTTDGPE